MDAMNELAARVIWPRSGMFVSVCWSYPYYIPLPTWIPPCWEFPPAFLQSPRSSWPKITWHAASAPSSAPLEKTLLEEGAADLLFKKKQKTVPLWPPWLRLIQNTDQNIWCELRLHERTGRRRQVERESSYFWTFFLHISPPKAGQRAFHVIFWHKTHPPLKAREDSSFNRAVSLSWDEPRIASMAFAPPAANEPK